LLYDGPVFEGGAEFCVLSFISRDSS